MKRTNVYVTDKQLERLRVRAEHEEVAMAELIRRAIDAFLAWNDPTSTPQPKPQIRNGGSSPRLKRLILTHILQIDFVKEPDKRFRIVGINRSSAFSIRLSRALPKMWVKVRLKKTGAFPLGFL